VVVDLAQVHQQRRLRRLVLLHQQHLELYVDILNYLNGKKKEHVTMIDI
jgi:hypothetical protein